MGGTKHRSKEALRPSHTMPEAMCSVVCDHAVNVGDGPPLQRRLSCRA